MSYFTRLLIRRAGRVGIIKIMEKYLKEMLTKGISLEVHCINNLYCFGLKWGEGNVARAMGFKRKDVIKTLKWADKNPKQALKLITIN